MPGYLVIPMDRDMEGGLVRFNVQRGGDVQLKPNRWK